VGGGAACYAGKDIGAVYAMRVVKWSDVRHTKTPGWFSVDGVSIHIEQKHIDAWLKDPDGFWTVATSAGISGPTTTSLREFHESWRGA
jgi:hypothetical protein